MSLLSEENVINNLENALSPYDNYCDGYGNSYSSGNSYILGVNIGVGVTAISLSHQGSQLLDQINAFDIAETASAYIGQINMSTVSSFCGPQGLIWGYDIVTPDNLYTKPLFDKPLKYKNELLDVYDANPLIEATEKLFGTVKHNRFILRPGAHVPFAGKNKFITSKGTIYAAFGIGIPQNREKNACILMEDIGILRTDAFETDTHIVLENVAKSIIEVGHNQNVNYKECFVTMKTCDVEDNMIGCALVAAPYFTLAKNAIIKTRDGQFDFKYMQSSSLETWEKTIFY